MVDKDLTDDEDEIMDYNAQDIKNLTAAGGVVAPQSAGLSKNMDFNAKKSMKKSMKQKGKDVGEKKKTVKKKGNSLQAKSGPRSYPTHVDY